MFIESIQMNDIYIVSLYIKYKWNVKIFAVSIQASQKPWRRMWALGVTAVAGQS
jgi:hypothetical protein